MFTGDRTARGLLSLTAVGQDQRSDSTSSPASWQESQRRFPRRSTNRPANTRTDDLPGRPPASAHWTLLARILWVLGGGEVLSQPMNAQLVWDVGI